MRNVATGMGTFYDRTAGIDAFFDRFNWGTAYGHKMIGNTYATPSLSWDDSDNF